MKQTLLFMLCFVPGLAGCGEGGGRTGDGEIEEAADSIEGDAEGNGDPDASQVDAVDAGPDEGNTGSCATAGDPPCDEGYLCVQSQPPYCSGDYIGYCILRPVNCTGKPGDPVCTCDDSHTPYSNECEARKAGYGGLLEDCP
jgi:hypothetical protein